MPLHRGMYFTMPHNRRWLRPGVWIGIFQDALAERFTEKFAATATNWKFEVLEVRGELVLLSVRTPFADEAHWFAINVTYRPFPRPRKAKP